MTQKECFKYIEKECRKFDLTSNTSDEKIEEYYVVLTGLDEKHGMNIKDKRRYLYDYLINDMIRNEEITLEQGKQYLKYLERKEKNENKEQER